MDFKLDKKLVKEFRDQWQAVAAIEAEEQLNASIELRWQQLNSILRMAIGLGLPLNDSIEDDLVVYQRWAKLRSMLQ
ncbi:MAG: hypothetical protein ONB37_04375 [candidate division KSB1 bacterium]|nr:hypothetical protein [candidate division KSB1 bacterium]